MAGHKFKTGDRIKWVRASDMEGGFTPVHWPRNGVAIWVRPVDGAVYGQMDGEAAGHRRFYFPSELEHPSIVELIGAM